MRSKIVTFAVSFILIGLSCGTFSITEVEASGTIFIRADGSIEPGTAPIETFDNVTYTFTDDINESIIVERNHTVIDGAGFAVQGNGTGDGFILQDIVNVTIINAEVKGFEHGIHLSNLSNNNTISENNVTSNNGVGVYLDHSYYNTISGNSITNNSEGIYLDSSGDNTLSNNTITHNYNGGIRLISSSSNVLSNNVLTENEAGIRLNLVSNNNTIYNNTVAHNDDGVHLAFSSGNTFSNNAVTNNLIDGVHLYSFSSNKFSNNTMTHNSYGIRLRASSDNNTFSNNTIANNEYGVHLAYSSGNSFYHNIFVFNDIQFYTQNSVNTWDDGSKGNYWDDYEDRYPNATEIGDSGIWDTPYVIDENNVDNYPIIPEFPSLVLLPLFMLGTLLATVFYRRKKSKVRTS